MHRDLFRWLEIAVSLCIWVGFPVLLVMFFFKKFRVWVGIILVNISYLTGFACWVFSFIVTYRTLEDCEKKLPALSFRAERGISP